MTSILVRHGVRQKSLRDIPDSPIISRMDTEKYKSVAVPRDVYQDIKLLAKHEDRPISKQLAKILKEWKQDRINEAESLSSHR